MNSPLCTLLLFLVAAPACQSTPSVSTDLRTLLLACPHESINFTGHYGRSSELQKLPEFETDEQAATTTVVHVYSQLFVVDANLLPTTPPIAVRIDANTCDQLLTQLVTNGQAERIHTPQLTCNDGQKAFTSVVNQHAVVEGFTVRATGGMFLTEPDIAIVQDGLRLVVEPKAAANDTVNIGVTLHSTQLQRPIPTIETNYGITIHTPTFLNQNLEVHAQLKQAEGLLICGIQASDEKRVIIALLRARAHDATAASR